MDNNVRISSSSTDNMLYLAIIVGLIGISLAACPAKWQHHGSSCYLLSTDELDWTTAREYDGGYLAELETKDESDYIETFAKQIDFWLGGRDEVEGHWKWVTSGKNFTYTDWHPGEPNDLNHDEDCLHLYGPHGYQWNDFRCSALQNYICEAGKLSVIFYLHFIKNISSSYYLRKSIKSTSSFLIGGSLAACPAKWLHHGSSCYYISTDELDWSTARDICQEYEGGYLAEVETKDESDYLETVTLTTHRGFWLGGKDEVEGHWKWMTSGKDFTYTDWSPNEPNDLNHNEDCLHLFQARSQHWNDIDCSIKQNYICETR
ncbi:MRC [Mytilus coruscus]|uniref:MRC n=1 Tax=Mytilus coruscus TaxID=42192 RepID=A0A6J8BYJ3_MYTCO|nr:MRC [Mytilus coruscus]